MKPERRSIRELAAEIRCGKRTARQEVEAATARRRANDLGAYLAFGIRSPRRQARAVDLSVARGGDPGPLAGITVSVKDLYALDGYPLRAGTYRALPGQEEGFLVRALRQLGAVLMGKTRTVEFAFGAVGLNIGTSGGTPANPWGVEGGRAPGGSSSGAGVSLWEGSARLALGTDTGGSVRIPASATGVVGFRPTTGRWPTTGVVPLSTTLDTVGLLAHTAADLRYAFRPLDQLAGHGPSAGAARAPVRPRDLRIGIAASALWRDADSGVAAVALEALHELRRAGAAVVEFDAPELDAACGLYFSGFIVEPEFGDYLKRELPEWVPHLSAIIAGRLCPGGRPRDAEDLVVPSLQAPERAEALRERHRLSAALQRRMRESRIDCLASPTLPIAPPLVGKLGGLATFYRRNADCGSGPQLEEYLRANRRMLSNTCPASVLDLPAISLPAGLDSEGMPVGLQLMGRTGTDLDLLNRAVAAETVLGTNETRLGLPPRLQD